jgi:CheY-like chemotaxis protein
MQLTPDIVVLDLELPDLNGIEATRHIKKESQTAWLHDVQAENLFERAAISSILKSDVDCTGWAIRRQPSQANSPRRVRDPWKASPKA